MCYALFCIKVYPHRFLRCIIIYEYGRIQKQVLVTKIISSIFSIFKSV